MKVEVKTQNELNSLPFPKLMTYKEDSNLIVLFTAKDCGICIKCDTNQYNKPYAYHEHWVTSEFTDFKGSITITQ